MHPRLTYFVVAFLTLLTSFGIAQTSLPRVALFDFFILGDNGNIISRSQSKSADLARLSTLLPRAMASLLQRSGRFEVILDLPLLETQTPTETAIAALAAGQADQVIVGSLAQVGKSVVISLERFEYVGDTLRRLNNSVLNVPTPDEVAGTSGRLLTELFPAEPSFVQQQLALLVLEPTALRLPVGRSAQVRPLALDASGKPIEGGRAVYASSNPAVAMVDENGNITALSPGQATISLQVVGVPRQGNLSASSPVTVIPPYFGLRVGIGATPKAGQFGTELRAGFNLTPTTPVTAPNVPRQTAQSTSGDPLTLLLSFFQSLLSSGPFTFSLGISQEQLDVGLQTTQWSDGRYLSVGLVYAQALNQSSLSTGLGIRLTTGLQFASFGNTAIPFELVTDVLFNSPGPTVRFALQTGINLFQ